MDLTSYGTGYDNTSGYGRFDALGAVYSVFTPTAPVLLQADDSGYSNTDGITNVTTPRFTGTAPLGSYVRLYVDGSGSPAGTQQSGISQSTYTIVPGSALTSGTHQITVKVAANSTATALSNASSAASVTIDTTAPSVLGAGPRGRQRYGDQQHRQYHQRQHADVRRFRAGRHLLANLPWRDAGFAAPSDGFGRRHLQGFGCRQRNVAHPADGTYSYTARAVDTAGNESGDSTALSVTIDTAAPVVTRVLVRSSTWSNAFLSSLGGVGYAIPDGPNQVRSLPWTNINTVIVEFSENVTVAQADMAIAGVNVPSYGFSPSSFVYDPVAHRASWTISQNLGRDKLLIDLNGSTTGAVADMAGNRLDGDWTNPTWNPPSPPVGATRGRRQRCGGSTSTTASTSCPVMETKTARSTSSTPGESRPASTCLLVSQTTPCSTTLTATGRSTFSMPES